MRITPDRLAGRSPSGPIAPFSDGRRRGISPICASRPDGQGNRLWGPL